MGVFSDMLEKYTSPWRLILGRGTDRDKEIQEQEVNKALDAIIKTTQPFRMGANVLTQGYGPAFRALTGGDPNRPGVVENFIREGVTPQEQKLIEEKPYMTALKSSAGMASTLMPFASRVAPASTLLARTGQIAGRGALEGLTGGFGYSREGKELQDTLIGGAIGMGSELLGNYIFDPNYRNMVNAQLDEGIPGKYQAALGALDDTGTDILRNSESQDIRGQFEQLASKIFDENGNLIPDTDQSLLQEAKRSIQKRGISGDKLLNAEDLIDEIKSVGANINADGTVTLYHHTTPQAKKLIESTGKMTGKELGTFFTTNPQGQATGYGSAVVKLKIPIEKLELDDIFGNEAHLKVFRKSLNDSLDITDWLSGK